MFLKSELPKAVSQRLLGVEAEVLEMAIIQLEEGSPETREYVLDRLRQALDQSISAQCGYSTFEAMAIAGYRAFEAMAVAGWEVKCNTHPDLQMKDEWIKRTRWYMQRSCAPYEFEDKQQIWFAPTFPDLEALAKHYGHGPKKN
jgi:hypothetical protein